MQKSFEELLRDLESPDRHDRGRAILALSAMGDFRALGPILRAMSDPAADVRAKAAAALGRLRDPSAVPTLIQAMRDDKVSVRTAAAAAVKKYGKQAYPPLLDAYKGASGTFRAALLTALARYKTPAVSELLIAALDSSDGDLRVQAVRFLGRRKDRRAVEPLLEVLAESRAALDRATERRQEGRHEEVWQEWTEIAPQLQCVVQALGEIRDERAFAPLQELLEIAEPRIHAGIVPDVVKALRSIDNARAVDLLHGMLDDQADAGPQWLGMTLAGMDLMNAAQSLRGAAKAGDFGVFVQALQYAGAAHRQVIAPQAEADPEAMSRNAVDVMRRLESTLRNLINKPESTDRE